MTWTEPLRHLVRSRAYDRCEYCLLHQTDAGFPHEIDHIVSRKHGGIAEDENLAFACYLCNRYKGSDIASVHPRTGQLVRLFHHRQHRWTEHFGISGPVIDPLTDIGFATLQLLRINTVSRVIERQLLQELNRYPKS